jgi:choline dehydrogenase
MPCADDDAWDYVIVGSGAGGGTLAARLAEAGMRVFLIEAGGDARTSGAQRMPDDYDVPAFHASASENPAMSWNFFVRHYADDAQQRRDPKCGPEGVLYPRAATLGGCTAHNAMIFVYPHASDWDDIAALTGDRSWRATHMRRYGKKLERCRHRPLWAFARRLGLDPTAHGFDGWLSTERASPSEALADDALMKLIFGSMELSARGFPRSLHTLLSMLRWQGDPNSRAWGKRNFQGVCYTPLTTLDHARQGARERVLDVASRLPARLHVELDALATRVLFDPGGAATGIEYLKGARLYRGHAEAAAGAGVRRQVLARREVILAGGAFNTPQLLMLSGIGPAGHLRTHGIPVRMDLPGVGSNLQDRYEVAVVSRMARPWQVLRNAQFNTDDPVYRKWRDLRKGVYITNGAAVAIARRSFRNRPVPDIFCMALVERFAGYFPGYSKVFAETKDVLSWTILKAHTRNHAGTVRLRSPDPRDMPSIDFRYFEEGDDTSGEDMRSLVESIRFVRGLLEPLARRGLIAREELPGPGIEGAALAGYVRDNAWGHHASCTCAIGAPSAGGVLDSGFSVHGVRRLRVVDASVFPKIPGFFLASAVYMIAEKAADVILNDAAHLSKREVVHDLRCPHTAGHEPG